MKYKMKEIKEELSKQLSKEFDEVELSMKVDRDELRGFIAQEQSTINDLVLNEGWAFEDAVAYVIETELL